MPFKNRTFEIIHFYHSNTGQVWYCDPHCGYLHARSLESLVTDDKVSVVSKHCDFARMPEATVLLTRPAKSKAKVAELVEDLKFGKV